MHTTPECNVELNILLFFFSFGGGGGLMKLSVLLYLHVFLTKLKRTLPFL
jgi:hypothetical protein